ncbi:uncharacterized protein LOC121384463 [Gigantopelta aegis]|uniref:uncharacterized protein LOC121384463 n=1 Tax=Gigantopelta aegis TaxID=1735272 RepID=UPI001B88BB7F|nr:uncharacterized protein LOC121384463 [Gigantopelta aegis]
MEMFFGTWRLVPGKNDNFEAFSDAVGLSSATREVYRDAIFVLQIARDGLAYRVRSTIEGVPGVETFKWEEHSLYPSVYRGRNGEPMATTIKIEDGKMKQRKWHLDDDISWDLEARREGDVMILTQRKNAIEWVQTYEKTDDISQIDTALQ